jgi:hypothetical protein
MLTAAAAVYGKHQCKESGAEYSMYRIPLMVEEARELSACRNKVKAKVRVGEECTDIMTLVPATPITADSDLRQAPCDTMNRVDRRRVVVMTPNVLPFPSSIRLQHTCVW